MSVGANSLQVRRVATVGVPAAIHEGGDVSVPAYTFVVTGFFSDRGCMSSDVWCFGLLEARVPGAVGFVGLELGSVLGELSRSHLGGSRMRPSLGSLHSQ